DLATVEPEIAREWAAELNGKAKPDSVTAHSTKRVYWRCKRGHAWESTISNRVEGYGCPYCSNQKVLAGYNDLATTNPALAAEWHPTKNGDVTPSDVIAGAHRKFWWICERGHEWEASLSGRNAGHGCPYCASIWVLPGFNDLATANPDIAKEWHPTRNADITPSTIAPKSNKKMWWICNLGHEWQASVADRTGGRSCPYCSNRLVLRGFNDLATTNPSLAAEWHPTKNGDLEPSKVMAGSSKRVWWKCVLGHEWQSKICHRNAGSGCPVCSGQRTERGFNDLQTVNPDLAAGWNYEKNSHLAPTDVRPNSNKKVWWVCVHGHEWEATINSRNRGNGCPYCSGRRPTPGVNDLATTNPDIALEWDRESNGNLTPTNVTAKSRKKVWWVCTRGHKWQAIISRRTGERNLACPYCLEEDKAKSYGMPCD
ncbi:MAG: zinc-ribbon domain-containing protein, partial [Atopobiaceae bacterium]|nr:zinc-ribbon domain-containing protein [Atopobiaceae bacterium]